MEIIYKNSPLYDGLRETYQKNINTLMQTNSTLGNSVQRIDLFSPAVLFTDDSFQYGMIDKEKATDQKTLLTDFDTIPARQDLFTNLNAKYDHLIFCGVGIGEYLLMLADQIAGQEKNNPSIWVIVEDALYFTAMLHFIDLHDLWLSPTIVLCIGQTAQKDFFHSFTNAVQEHQQALIVPDAIGQIDAMTWEITERLSLLENLSVDLFPPVLAPHISTITSAYHVLNPENQSHSTLRNNYNKNHAALSNSPHFHRSQEFNALLQTDLFHCYQDSDGGIGVAEVLLNVRKNGIYWCSPTKVNLDGIVTKLNQFNSYLHTYLLIGSDAGELISSFMEETTFDGQWEDFGQIIYLIEPNPYLFKLLMFFVSFEKFLPSNRLILFAGKDSPQRFAQYLRGQAHTRIPNSFLASNLYKNTKLHGELGNLSNEILTEVIEKTKDISNITSAYYDGISLSEWIEKFRTKRLKILAITSRMTSFLQYCTRDVMEGFQQAGHETMTLIEKDGLSSLRISDKMQAIYDFKPDLLFVIDHLRDECWWIPKNIPYVCWIQDFIDTLYLGREYNFTDFDFTYVINKSWIQLLRETNKSFKNTRMSVLPLGCNEKIHYQIKNCQKEFDLTYISHLFNLELTFWPFRLQNVQFVASEDELQIINKGLFPLNTLITLYKILSKQLENLPLRQLTSFITESKKYVPEFLHTISHEYNIPIPKELIKYLSTFQNRFFYDTMIQIKTRPFKILSQTKFKIAVWGNNWEKIPYAQKYAQGKAKNSSQVNLIQNATKINLNNSGGNSFHMRALEILSSNNFMLSRFIEQDGHPLTDYFTEGTDIIFFNEEDLIEKVSYYADKKEIREEIANNAYLKTIERFSYKNISLNIVNDISEKMTECYHRNKANDPDYHLQQDNYCSSEKRVPE